MNRFGQNEISYPGPSGTNGYNKYKSPPISPAITKTIELSSSGIKSNIFDLSECLALESNSFNIDGITIYGPNLVLFNYSLPLLLLLLLQLFIVELNDFYWDLLEYYYIEYYSP